MKTGSADVPGDGAAEFVDPPLELSEVSSVDVAENGGQESRDCTHGSDEVHDSHRNVSILSHGLRGAAAPSGTAAPRHRTPFRLAESFRSCRRGHTSRPPFSEKCLTGARFSSSDRPGRPIGSERGRRFRARADQVLESVEPEARRDPAIQGAPGRRLPLEMVEQAGTQEDAAQRIETPARRIGRTCTEGSGEDRHRARQPVDAVEQAAPEPPVVGNSTRRARG